MLGFPIQYPKGMRTIMMLQLSGFSKSPQDKGNGFIWSDAELAEWSPQGLLFL